MKSLLGDGNQEPEGNNSKEAAPHEVYPCKGENRWCAVAVFTEDEWQGFKQALGNPAWTQDKKFGTLSGRVENKAELDRRVGAWTKRLTDRKSTRLNSSHGYISYAVFCLK